MLLNNSPTPLYHQLKSILEDKIRSQELKERLPSEFELCSQYNVSRTTVRQAIAELMKEGLIYRERGKGTFVWKGPGWKSPSLRGSIENLMASGVGTRIKVLSYKKVPVPKDLSEKLKMVKSGKVHRLEIVRMISEGPQGYSLIYFPPELGKMISRDDIKETTEIISLAENKLGIEVHGAHQTISVGLASRLLAKCLSIKPRSPLLIICREYFTRKGSLMILSKIFYRPDRFEYEIELTRK